MSESSLAEAYSKAFETLVQRPQDIIGLLAYAQYKASIRESIGAGREAPKHHRNLTSTEILAWRGMAERVLPDYATEAISEASPDIISAAHKSAKDDIIAEVRKRTGILATVVSGVLVWLVTVLITVTAVLAAPDWVRALVEHATRAK